MTGPERQKLRAMGGFTQLARGPVCGVGKGAAVRQAGQRARHQHVRRDGPHAAQHTAAVRLICVVMAERSTRLVHARAQYGCSRSQCVYAATSDRQRLDGRDCRRK